METELLAPLFFVIISLVAGAILKYLLRKARFHIQSVCSAWVFCSESCAGAVSSTTPAYCYVISEKD